jgi:hypothetical protein
MKKFTINLSTIVVGLILIGVIFFGYQYYGGKIDSIKNTLATEIKIKNALVDTVKFEKNKRNEVVAEKLTLQGTVKQLSDENNKLTGSQKDLLKRVKEVEKENSIITAALIKTKVSLDSIRDATSVVVDNIKHTVTFSDSINKEFKYEFLVSNVLEIPSVKPSLHFNKFELVNEQFIEFNWGSRKEGYPISFSTTNTNKFFKTSNIDSYAIPQLQKPLVKPTTWQKIKDWTQNTGGKMTIFGVGVGIGFLIFKYL